MLFCDSLIIRYFVWRLVDWFGFGFGFGLKSTNPAQADAQAKLASQSALCSYYAQPQLQCLKLFPSCQIGDSGVAVVHQLCRQSCLQGQTLAADCLHLSTPPVMNGSQGVDSVVDSRRAMGNYFDGECDFNHTIEWKNDHDCMAYDAENLTDCHSSQLLKLADPSVWVMWLIVILMLLLVLRLYWNHQQMLYFMSLRRRTSSMSRPSQSRRRQTRQQQTPQRLPRSQSQSQSQIPQQASPSNTITTSTVFPALSLSSIFSEDDHNADPGDNPENQETLALLTDTTSQSQS